LLTLEAPFNQQIFKLILLVHVQLLRVCESFLFQNDFSLKSLAMAMPTR
jgi:hypothetical protein